MKRLKIVLRQIKGDGHSLRPHQESDREVILFIVVMNKICNNIKKIKGTDLEAFIFACQGHISVMADS
jgi:hypothetical protein